MRLTFFLLTLIIALGILHASQPAIKEADGNIILVVNGRVRTLTRSGHDKMPHLSLNGQYVTFVRSSQPGSDELWFLDLENSADRKLLAKGDIGRADGFPIGAIFDPQFSPDGSAIYFYNHLGNFGTILRLSTTEDTSPVIVSHSLIPLVGVAFEVIPKGKYAGHLIVRKDSEKLAPGRLFLYWLLDKDGRNTAIIGQDDSDLDSFREIVATEAAKGGQQ